MIAQRETATPSAQQQAVMNHAIGTPALVDAGAGTGKTFTIVERVAQLGADPDRGCAPLSILLLTFSKKAAGELRGRLIRRLGPGAEPPECSTFHAFALSILKDHAFDLDLSPDFILINDIDARVEFSKVFDEMLRGAVASGAEAFSLRYRVRDDVCAALFDVRQQLRDQAISIHVFRARAIAAARAFAAIGHRRLIEPRVRGGPVEVYSITDAEFAREIDQERVRIEAAAALFERFDERLRSRDALTYADLLDRAEIAVREHPEIRAQLRSRFRHCIVDEYQDTDPRQVRLLAAIFGSALEAVMAVGDPRQAIYAFRGARPQNVDDFRNVPGCAPYALTLNRRSHQEILDFAHAVISKDHGDPEPLEARRAAAGRPVVHAASRWSPAGYPHPKAAESREYEARAVAARVVALLSSGRSVERADAPGSFEPIAPRHIAVLSRTKTKLQPLISALIDANIPFRQFGGAGFYEAPEVLDALAWLRLLADPLDGTAIARVLASTSIGAADATVTALCRGSERERGDFASLVLVNALPVDLDSDGRERVERLRRVVETLEQYAGAPLPEAWEALLDRTGLLLSVSARGGRRTDQARANLAKLTAIANSFADRNPGARAADFVRYLGELGRADADDQEADPPAADAVSVMTIHAAKGLEWPVVFLVNVWPRNLHRERRVRIDASTGALLAGEGGSGKKPFHTESIERQDDGFGNVPRKSDRCKDGNAESEERRLFYVALTRARDELFVSGRRDALTGRPHEFLSEAVSWIESRGWPTIEEPAPSFATYEPIERLAIAGSVRPLADFVREGEVRLAATAPTLSFSLVSRFERCPRSANYRIALHVPDLNSEAAHADGAVDLYGRPARSPDSLLALGRYGQLVHRALELWARHPGAKANTYVDAAARDLAVKPSGTESGRAARAVQMVADRLAGWKPLLAEAPFILDFDGVSVAGSIDLIIADPSGRAHIVDYKTGTAPAGHYALQLAIYRVAADKAYALDIHGCKIARIAERDCTLENVTLPDEVEVRTRMAAVAEGIRNVDLTARPGAHCASCPYRAAPCLDFA